ncbi:immunity 52 family protein, partial [Photorhabdus laumondii]
LYMGEDKIHVNPVRLGKTNISISINLDKDKFNFQDIIELLKNSISIRNSPFMLVDTRGYSLKQKQVFPDRVYAGWMLYLPIEIDPTLVPMAEEIISISDKNNKKGSLIITTKDIFDIENQEHINKANDIEICLRDLQILPLITEI